MAGRVINLSKVDLDLENPRHKALKSESEVIEYLCENAKILALARDIKKRGLNQIERIALIPKGSRYFVGEGNRRVCAIKLLNDPSKAPEAYVDRFRAASKGWKKVHTVDAVIYKNRKDIAVLLERVHGGANKGRGRLQWTGEQKARHLKQSKNDLAVALLDWGEDEGLITAQKRKRKMSTVQRYVSNPSLRRYLGVGMVDKTPYRYFEIEGFRRVMAKFLDDLANRRLTTRDNSDAIRDYSNELTKIDGYPSGRIEEGVPLFDDGGDNVDSELDEKAPDSKLTNHGEDSSNPPRVVMGDREELAGLSSGGTQAVRRPKLPPKIPQNAEVKAALDGLGNFKITQLYYSICAIEVAKHTPLLTVGIWSLLESLTGLAGRNSGTSFGSFLSHNRLKAFGADDNDERKTWIAIVNRLAEVGNTTKHNPTAAYFNTEQLVNDFQSIERLLLLLAESCLEAEEV